MEKLDRPGFGNLLELQRALGLRAAEAVRGGNEETLARWQRELQRQGYVHVFSGTKGGRGRNVRPADGDRALTAIRQARATLKATGQRYLVTRPNGAPAKNLKEALGIRRNLCYRAGIRSHGARYAFTRERLQAYRDADYREREARAATSVDLGHGDGRGRYVASVYAKDCS